VPEGARILLYLGRLHPKKNLANLLRAWATVKKSGKGHESWHLAIVGWEERGYLKLLKRLAFELEVGDSVTFAGPVYGRAKHETLCSADAFILPSTSEGLPMAVLEAWAYKLPVAMTKECNLPEGFQRGAAIEVGTSAGRIAEGIRELEALTDVALRDMAMAGRRLVEERFSWSEVAQEMAKVYRWVVGGGERPQSLWED
jgi:poly(glycerol-phosphate) alpha-glucosyltransferase